jgi:hypothetical protein
MANSLQNSLAILVSEPKLRGSQTDNSKGFLPGLYCNDSPEHTRVLLKSQRREDGPRTTGLDLDHLASLGNTPANLALKLAIWQAAVNPCGRKQRAPDSAGSTDA